MPTAAPQAVLAVVLLNNDHCVQCVVYFRLAACHLFLRVSGHLVYKGTVYQGYRAYSDLKGSCGVLGSRAVCRCRDGYVGDPFSECRLEPCASSPCGTNADCSSTGRSAHPE